MEYGEHIKLNNYTLWCHDLISKDWSINGYKKLCEINNVSSFWRLFNNFKKIGWKRYHFYFMKSEILPLWEDPANIGGGIFIIKDCDLNLWEQLGLYLVAEELGNNINGISINLKEDRLLIKIWCATLDPQINPEFLEKVKDNDKFFSHNKK